METAKHGPPPVQFEVESFEVVLLRQPDALPDYDEETIRSIQAEHLGYLFNLQAVGTLKAAGAVTGHPSLTGIGFYQLGSIDEVRSLTEADPGVLRGIDAFEVITLLCPKGALEFPKAGRAG